MKHHSVMKQITSFVISCLAVLATGCSQKVEAPSEPDYYICTFVWPSCHDDSLAHAHLWREGIGEWEVIKQGDPRFPGHYQPKQPLWGYEMDDDPKVVERWIDTAVEYGINTFIYDWYWYNTEDGYSGPYLESALDNGFLGAPNNEKMYFYIMWANHVVKKNYWNYHLYGDDTSVLFDPKVDWEQFRKIVARVIDKYFKLPNYVKIDGCPVFSIFDLDQLVESFGSLEEASKAMAYFRDEVRKAGFPGLHVQESKGDGFFLDGVDTDAIQERIHKLGIDSHAFYDMGGFNTDYMTYGQNGIRIREQWDEAFDVPTFPTVNIGWDPTPRFPEQGGDDITRYNQTPRAFQSYLEVAREYADCHPDQPRFVMINAWNEWVEGSYLLPDRYFGYGYLEAVRNVFGQRRPAGQAQ